MEPQATENCPTVTASPIHSRTADFGYTTGTNGYTGAFHPYPPALTQPASDNDLPLLAGTWNEWFDDARATPLTELFAGTPVGNIAMAALTNTQSVHQLNITGTGLIEIRDEPEDTGTYSFARGYLTLISNRTRHSDRYQYKLSVATAAIPLVTAVPGDGLLDLTGFSSYPTRWVRKADGNPESLVGFWKTPLLTFVSEMTLKGWPQK